MTARVLWVLLALSWASACGQADPLDSAESEDAGAGTGGSAGSRAGAGGNAGAGTGGNAGTSGNAGTGGSQNEPEYFPLRDGASWTYLHSNGQWNEEISIEALVDDRFLSTSSADPDGISSESTFELKDGEVLRVAEDLLVDGALDQSSEYDPGFLRFSQAWADEAPGFSERRVYQRTETKAGGSPKAPAERAHIFTLESDAEDVTVPAGTFRNCLRVRRQRDYEVTASDGSTVAEEQEKLYWFCPGVGKVREENTLTSASETLMKYDLPE